MSRIERMRKRLHILQTKLGSLNQTELEYIEYLKREISDSLE